jgi:hypothetical protein
MNTTFLESHLEQASYPYAFFSKKIFIDAYGLAADGS